MHELAGPTKKNPIPFQNEIIKDGGTFTRWATVSSFGYIEELDATKFMRETTVTQGEEMEINPLRRTKNQTRSAAPGLSSTAASINNSFGRTQNSNFSFRGLTSTPAPTGGNNFGTPQNSNFLKEKSSSFNFEPFRIFRFQSGTHSQVRFERRAFAAYTMQCQ